MHETKTTPANFVGGRPRIPSHLAPLARKAFKRAVQLLENRRTLTPSDEPTLELYAETYAFWVEAKTSVHADGMMIDTSVKDKHGNDHIVKRVNPMIKVMEAAAQRLLALSKSLGFSQVDIGRCKTTAADTAEDNKPIPGSAWDLHPEMYDSKGNFIGKKAAADVLPFVPLPPPDEDEDEDETL